MVLRGRPLCRAARSVQRHERHDLRAGGRHDPRNARNGALAHGRAARTDRRRPVHRHFAHGLLCEKAVAWAYENEVVNGTSPTTFEPDGKITREQIATILYRYAEKKGYDVSKQNDLSGYPDADKVSGYAKTALAWANALELVRGHERGGGVDYLDPQGHATAHRLRPSSCAMQRTS